MKRTWIRRLAVFMSLALILSVCNTNVTVSAATKKKVSVKTVSITHPGTSVLTMKKGASYTLKYSVSPKNATSKKVKFATSNKKVATVSAKGTVRAVNYGTAKITVESTNHKKDSITVKVGSKVTSVTLNKTSLTLTKGSAATLKATVKPSSATYKKVSFTTSNSKVATVSSTGKVTAKGAGTAKIKAAALDGSGKYSTCTVTVIEKVTSVTLNKTSLTLTKGSAATLKATVKPSSATYKKVSFTTSNSKVATVSSTGKVTAKGAGTAKIKAAALDGSGKYSTCTVTVVEKVTSVTLNKTSLTLTKGSQATLKATVKPSTATNKKVSFTTSNSKVATVSAAGIVTAKSNGTAVIKATALDGSKKYAACTVTVKDKPVDPDAYALVFEDDFNGTELNKDNWNYETHEPGWVNNELQEYTDSDKNVYVENGNLVIKANKEKKVVDGVEQDWYTSGKVTSQNKHDFKYGKFEIRAKGLEGQGLWPAIWMMPRNENFYGQWPRCGEIDIMELLGHEPNKSYATIHYGNPHQEQQGIFTLENGTLADDYHVYGLEWEPDHMDFFVDGKLISHVTDWYTATEGKGEVTFPAPFDQFFYLQFNLAVGGNWPGNPDDSTNFDNAKFMIDYVKVYQKAAYNENVTKPVKPEPELREPDEDGNYIVNGNFENQEDLSDDIDWGEKYANGGVGKVTFEDNQMVVRTENAGSVDYSVQIVQPNLPMLKGGTYRLTFDAYADEARTMITDVSGPDNSYVRYFNDTKVNLTTEKQPFVFDFTMTNNSDANGRLEFNLGKQDSTATVYISNVKLIKTGETEILPPAKTILSDGNYVYNGEFQEGQNRMDYWKVTKPANATVSVTNETNNDPYIYRVRELLVNAPASTALDDILVQQDVAVAGGKIYVLTFDAYADKAKTIEARIDGQKFEANLTTEKKQFKYVFTTSETITEKDLVFALGTAGITRLDNVRLAENGLLLNGDFVSDFAGWEPFVDSGIKSEVTYTVDSQKENQAAAFEIKDTGDEVWKIQLMQKGIKLEKDKWYELTFDAKTDLEGGRDMQYALQQDGGDYIPYSGNQVAALTDSYQTFKVKFQMSYETDEATCLSFSMGTAAANRITKTHNIYIDNVVLKETEAEPEEIEVPVVEGNMIQNADFTEGTDGLKGWEGAITPPGKGEITASENGVNVKVEDPGTADWNVQLKQLGLGLNRGHKYQIKMKITSSTARTIKVALMNPDKDYTWYGGADLTLEAGVNDIDTTFTVDQANCDTIGFYLSMGKIDGVNTPAGTLRIEGIWLEDITE